MGCNNSKPAYYNSFHGCYNSFCGWYNSFCGCYNSFCGCYNSFCGYYISFCGCYISFCGCYISFRGLYISFCGCYISFRGWYNSFCGCYISFCGCYISFSSYYNSFCSWIVLTCVFSLHQTDAQRFCGLLSVAINQHQANTNIEKTLNKATVLLQKFPKTRHWSKPVLCAAFYFLNLKINTKLILKVYFSAVKCHSNLISHTNLVSSNLFKHKFFRQSSVQISISSSFF